MSSLLKDRFFYRYRIGPSEVENALMEHPAVVETAVVSSPDPIRGEVMGELGGSWEVYRMVVKSMNSGARLPGPKP